MPKITLVFLRHCESVFNTGQNTKSIDCGLSSRGYRHAITLSGHNDITKIICSTLRRCKETLKLSSLAKKARNNIIYTDLCREHKTDICDYLQGEDTSVVETEEELLIRIEKFKKFIQLQYDNTHKILIVAHADFIWYFTSYIIENERFGQWLKNGELFEFVYEF